MSSRFIALHYVGAEPSASLGQGFDRNPWRSRPGLILTVDLTPARTVQAPGYWHTCDDCLFSGQPMTGENVGVEFGVFVVAFAKSCTSPSKPRGILSCVSTRRTPQGLSLLRPTKAAASQRERSIILREAERPLRIVRRDVDYRRCNRTSKFQSRPCARHVRAMRPKAPVNGRLPTFCCHWVRLRLLQRRHGPSLWPTFCGI